MRSDRVVMVRTLVRREAPALEDHPQRLRREACPQAHVRRHDPHRRMLAGNQGHRLRAPPDGGCQKGVRSRIRGPKRPRAKNLGQCRPNQIIQHLSDLTKGFAEDAREMGFVALVAAGVDVGHIGVDSLEGMLPSPSWRGCWIRMLRSGPLVCSAALSQCAGKIDLAHLKARRMLGLRRGNLLVLRNKPNRRRRARQDRHGEKRHGVQKLPGVQVASKTKTRSSSMCTVTEVPFSGRKTPGIRACRWISSWVASSQQQTRK